VTNNIIRNRWLLLSLILLGLLLWGLGYDLLHARNTLPLIVEIRSVTSSVADFPGTLSSPRGNKHPITFWDGRFATRRMVGDITVKMTEEQYAQIEEIAIRVGDKRMLFSGTEKENVLRKASQEGAQGQYRMAVPSELRERSSMPLIGNFMPLNWAGDMQWVMHRMLFSLIALACFFLLYLAVATITKPLLWSTFLVGSFTLLSSTLLFLDSYSLLAAGNIPDDAFYYLKTAQNFAAGLGITFDGANRSSGFHPLWMFVYALLFGKVSDPFVATYGAIVFQCVLMVIAGILFYRILRKIGLEKWIALAVAALLIASQAERVINLLETPLYMLFLMLTIHVLYSVFLSPDVPWLKRDVFLFSLLLFILFLARTEGILFFGAVLVWLVFSKRSLGEALIFVTPYTLFLSLYFLFNLLYFGSPLPISGKIKMDQTIALWQNSASAFDFMAIKIRFMLFPAEIGPAGKILFIQFFSLIPFFFSSYFLVAKKKCRTAEAALAFILSTFLFLKYLYYTGIHHGLRAASDWYWIVDVFLSAIIMVLLIADREKDFLRHPPRPIMLIAMLLVSLCLVQTLDTIRFRMRPALEKIGDERAALLDISDMLSRSSFFEGKRICSFNAGILGFFSGRQVTNLDGLINSTEFYEVLRTGSLVGYMNESCDVVTEYHYRDLLVLRENGFELFDVSPLIFEPISSFLDSTSHGYKMFVARFFAPQFAHEVMGR